MSTRNPADWMWTHAIEMLEQAERMHRQFFRLAASERTRPTWEPPVDVFEDEDGIVIVVALPGVPADRVEVAFEPGALVVRAERPLPFSGTAGDPSPGNPLWRFRAAHSVEAGATRRRNP